MQRYQRWALSAVIGCLMIGPTMAFDDDHIQKDPDGSFYFRGESIYPSYNMYGELDGYDTKEGKVWKNKDGSWDTPHGTIYPDAHGGYETKDGYLEPDGKGGYYYEKY